MVNWHDWRMNFIPAESWWIFLRCSLRLNFSLKLFPQSKSWQVWTFWSSTISAYFVWLREGLKKQLQKRSGWPLGPPPPKWSGCCDFFKISWYFDLFYHFIMRKIGPKFSQIVSVRLEGGDPPSKAVSLTAFSVFFNPSLKRFNYAKPWWQIKTEAD